MLPTPGLHHITVVGSDPGRNLAFYTGVLGLRLVKKTVNYEDPQTYHLYYAVGSAAPGTVLTFFLNQSTRPGVPGKGQASAVRFAAPRGSIHHWNRALDHAGAHLGHTSYGEQVLRFQDPDGTSLELVEAHTDGREQPALAAIAGVTLRVADHRLTTCLLRGALGLDVTALDEARSRLQPPASTGAPAHALEIQTDTNDTGQMGAGIIHHVAFRAIDDSHQLELQNAIAAAGCSVTPVIDRTYFRSVYFHEPGGVKLEIATDRPGFCVDEPEADLGTRLVLPPRLEKERARIESSLRSGP